MAVRRATGLAGLCLVGVVAAGCADRAAIHVETTIHPDGSCDRVILQPKNDFLPDQALKPAWNARWKSVMDAKDPSGDGGPNNASPYFIARGSFKSPAEIPPHYHLTDKELPGLGASEIERTYERNDLGFVVEHRWREKITNIVTFPGFLKSRDKLLDLFIPVCVDAIQRIFSDDYDVSRLVDQLRGNGRRFLENAAVILYDAAARGRLRGADGAPDPALVVRLLEEAERFGFDVKPLRGAFTLVADRRENVLRFQAFLGRVVARYFRRPDGSPVTPAEADALIQAISTKSRYEKEFQEESERINRFTRENEPAQKWVKRALLRMTGLYLPGFRWSIEYDFAIALPGELVETNGVGTKAGRTRWRFTNADFFPDGREMKARSLVIDRDEQQRVLGRVAIDDEAKALEFVETVGREGSVLEAFRAIRKTGDRTALDRVNARTPEEGVRAEKLRKLLFEK